MKYTPSSLVRNMLTKYIASALAISAVCSGYSFAACGTPNTYLSQTQLNQILSSGSGAYACGQKGGSMAEGWNEQHAGGGALIEQHEGGTSKETVGNWATSTSASRGRVTYTYGGGVITTYEVATVGANCNSDPSGVCTTLPQNYQFCGVGTSNLTIRISNSSTPTGCPNN